MKKWYLILILFFVVGVREVKAFASCNGANCFLSCPYGYVLIDNTDGTYKIKDKSSKYDHVCVRQISSKLSCDTSKGFESTDLDYNDKTCTKTLIPALKRVTVTCPTVSIKNMQVSYTPWDATLFYDCNTWRDLAKDYYNNPEAVCAQLAKDKGSPTSHYYKGAGCYKYERQKVYECYKKSPLNLCRPGIDDDDCCEIPGSEALGSKYTWKYSGLIAYDSKIQGYLNNIAAYNSSCSPETTVHYYYGSDDEVNKLKEENNCRTCCKYYGSTMHCDPECELNTLVCESFRWYKDPNRQWNFRGVNSSGYYCDYIAPYPGGHSSTIDALNPNTNSDRKKFEIYYSLPAKVTTTYYCPGKGKLGCTNPDGSAKKWVSSGEGSKMTCLCTVNASKTCQKGFTSVTITDSTGKKSTVCRKVVDSCCNGDCKKTCDCSSAPGIPDHPIPSIPKQTKTMSCANEKVANFSSGNTLRYDNGLCRVRCSDSVTTTFQGPQFAYAGRGIEYPVDIEGNRTCSLEYGYYDNDDNWHNDNGNQWQKWVNIAAENVKKCGDECSCGTIVQGWQIRLTTLIKMGTECQDQANIWKTAGFDVSDGFSAKIKDDKGTIKSKEYKKDTTDNKSTSSSELTNKSSYKYTILVCKGPNGDCSMLGPQEVTLTEWNLEAKFKNSYIFKKYTYINKYDGEILETDDPLTNYTDNYYYEGNKYYTSVNQKTGNNYSLNVAIPDMLSKWAIDMRCYYDLDNRLFPPDNDTHYPAWGNVAFMYRQISLTDPFPTNHVTGSNWKGKEKNITNLGQKVYDQNHIQYFVILSPTTRQNIRIYNQTHSYTDYNLYGNDLSNFIRKGQYAPIFTIK